jgi:hypothetical protein
MKYCERCHALPATFRSVIWLTHYALGGIVITAKSRSYVCSICGYLAKGRGADVQLWTAPLPAPSAREDGDANER